MSFVPGTEVTNFQHKLQLQKNNFSMLMEYQIPDESVEFIV